jgi:DNA polymerase III subunit delta'
MTVPDNLPAVNAPLPWQAQDWSRLGLQVQNRLLPHGLLLDGPRHTGKARFALALARLLLCQQPRDGLNCGRCHPCELSASGSHGDFRWLQPQDKSRVIKIDQVRQVVEFATKTASFGQRKVVVLSPANSMNISAANALLKSLEEPAEDTYLILVCDRLHGLPATIRSRCQLLRLAIPDQEQSLAWLDQLTGERTQSALLLELAGGRPLLAERLFQEDGVERLQAIHLVLAEVVRGKASSADVAALLADEGLEQVLARLAEELQVFLRTLGKEQLQSPGGRAAFGLLDELTGLQRAVTAGANPNRQLLLDAILAKFHRQLGDGGAGGNIQA